jgi:hypothetical protein
MPVGRFYSSLVVYRETDRYGELRLRSPQPKRLVANLPPPRFLTSRELSQAVRRALVFDVRG